MALPAFTPLGEGRLTVQPIAVPLEQLDKIWTTLESTLQPFMLYEVGPVQLAPLRPPIAPGPVVRPGGLALGVVSAGSRPVITEVTPVPVRAGGRLRVDLARPAELQAVLIDAVAIPAASFVASGATLAIDLAAAGIAATGPHTVIVQAGGVFSAQSHFDVGAPLAPLLDAPLFPHDPAANLVLTGAGLTGADAAFAWPPAGIRAPDEVINIGVTNVSTSAVTIPAGGVAGLNALAEIGTTWRLALRINGGQFTPHVRLDLVG
jgi:hypothetical protein